MSQPPTTARTFDYGRRWGIEAMFSDFKSRGFGLEDSQLQRTDRMDRLILVMSLALYWAVSTGMWATENAAIPVEKKTAAARPKKVARSLMSFFKRGLRRIQTCLQRLCGLPALWSVWRN